jgi:acyl-CoA dehydrogenase
VASIRTRAERSGDSYVVNGAKMFITSGMRADYYTVAVRTGGPGARGISLLLIEKGTQGFTRTPLKKMGWWASDTAALHFDDCRVPAGSLIGAENSGFSGIMFNFNRERIGMAAAANAFSAVCLDEAIAWARERRVFGSRLIDQQIIRHKLVDMAMRINATQAYLEALAWRVGQGESPIADIAMLKNQATRTMAFCASEAVQIHGGMGFMRGTKVERIYREVKVNAIGGGAEEIMKELAARQMGF